MLTPTVEHAPFGKRAGSEPYVNYRRKVPSIFFHLQDKTVERIHLNNFLPRSSNSTVPKRLLGVGGEWRTETQHTFLSSFHNSIPVQVQLIM